MDPEGTWFQSAIADRNKIMTIRKTTKVRHSSQSCLILLSVAGIAEGVGVDMLMRWDCGLTFTLTESGWEIKA
jgi:hypothetical protein